jgi:hypothetical protein
MAFSLASQIISFLLVGFCRKKHIHIFQYLPIKASYYIYNHKTQLRKGDGRKEKLGDNPF